MNSVKNESTKKNITASKKRQHKVLQDPEVSSSRAEDKPKRPNKQDDDDQNYSFLDISPSLTANYKSKLGKRYRSDEKWYTNQFDEIEKDLNIDANLLKKFEQYASTLINKEIDIYESYNSKSQSDNSAWLQNISVGGTTSDRIAAMAVQIHNNPIVSLSKIKILVSKVDKSNRREALLTAEALRDLFSQTLLPDRKLVTFNKRPLLKIRDLSSGNKFAIDKRLIFWLFEDTLKSIYEDFTKQLEKITHDSVDSNRIKAVSILVELLIRKPEQEQFLLSSIVNKLGDPSAKVATKTVQFLHDLIDTHAKMKFVVVSEVKNLIYRLHITPRAQFYALSFLTRVKLQRSLDADLACALITIYFNLFKILVEKGVVENKILTLLLKGTNKAFDVAKEKKGDSLFQDIDTLYKVIAVGSLNTSLQAMLLLLQVLEAGEGVTDRFYSSVYRKLLDPTVESSGHNHPMLFHVLCKTLKSDPQDGRALAVIKRVLQVALYAPPPFACAALALTCEVAKGRRGLLKLSKNAQNVDLIFNTNDLDGDSDEEHYTDVHGAESEAEQSDVEKKRASTKSSSWLHKTYLNTKHKNKFEYDPMHRNPTYANARSTLLYEIDLLQRHYHPSVALFSKKVLQGERIDYSGDPLQDFTLMRFLDRFAYRNPKGVKRTSSKVDPDDTSQQPKKLPKRTSYRPWGVKQLAVTSDEYAKTPESSVPVDEQYLHKYITHFGISKPGLTTANDETCSVGSEELEE